MIEPGASDAIYLFDLSCWVHRFFRTPGGPKWAGRNFHDLVGRVVRERRPAYAALCADLPFPTWRADKYPAYKGNRPALSGGERAALLDMLRQASELTEDMYGVRTFSARGFEADDVVATLTAQARAAGLRVVIVALDKDLMQLVEGTDVVMWDTHEVWWGPAEVAEKFGVEPARVVEYLTLVGDSADNIPGVRGVGPVAAAKVLGAFSTVAKAIEEANAEGPERGANHWFFRSGNEKVWAKLVASGPDAERWRELVTLRRDAPVTLGNLDALRPLA